MKPLDNNSLVRKSLIEQAQELAARHSETGINPDSLFIFATSEIAGILAYLRRIHAEKASLTSARK